MREAPDVLAVTGINGKLGKRLSELKPKSTKIISINLRNTSHKDIFETFASQLPTKFNSLKILNLAWPVDGRDYLGSEENRHMLQKSIQISKLFYESFNSNLCGVGSILEVGNNMEVLDNSAPDPLSIYAECKAELSCNLAKMDSRGFQWFRVAYQFSAFDPPHKLIPSLLSNSNTIIRNPDAYRDYIHVSDAAKGIWALLEANALGTSIVGTGRSLSPRQIAAGLGAHPQIISSTATSNQRTFPKNLDKLGWKAEVVSPSEIKTKLEEERNGS